MAAIGLNLTDIFSQLNLTTQSLEDKIRSQIATGGSGDNGSLTNLEMLSLQQQVNNWSLASNLETNVLKTISDTIKATVQNVH